MRDVYYVFKTYELNVGFIFIDQEKAFDYIDHTFLFKTLEVFGVGNVLSW